MRLIESTKEKVRKSFLWSFLKENIYLILFSTLVFLTPLITISGANELYEFPKMFFVYLFGFFIITVFLTDYVIHRFKLKRISLTVLLFMFVLILSTILSSDLYTSIFGYYTRFNDGLLSYMVYFGLYVVAINKIKKEDFIKILKISLLTIIPISIVGIAQKYGITLVWPYLSVERVFSTLGQPNWLAQYLAVLLPITVYFGLTEKSKASFLWVFIYCLDFFCFWLTYSLSGLLGLVVGLATFVLFFVIKEVVDKEILLKILVMGLFSSVVILTNSEMFKSKIDDAVFDITNTVSFVQKVYAAGEVYKLSDPGYIRKELWRTSFLLIRSSTKNMLIGTGPETFPYVYQPFRGSGLNYSSEWDFVFNKPHNYYLEIWAECGIFALFLYLGMIFKAAFNSHYFVFPALAVFLVTNIFGWPVVSTALLFWILVAYSEV
jgi:putative inorganic carbon (HCO3(-)) transporter